MKHIKIKKTLSKRVKGASLQEVIMVIVIIGILAGVGLVKFTSLFSKAKSKEAEIELQRIQSLEKFYYYEHSTYTADFSKISYDHRTLKKDGGSGNYKIVISEANDRNFKATATSQSDTDGDGVYNVWEITKEGSPKEVVPD